MVNKKTKNESIQLYDTLILGATVYDGSGTVGAKQDVAIRGDKIVAIGYLNKTQAKQVVFADGLILAPGFIDVHTHDDLELLRNPKMFNKISQGVTSVIIGNCGISASPYQSSSKLIDPINLLGKEDEFIFPCLSHFIEKFSKINPSVNAAALVGHTSLRAQVMSSHDRPATSDEISKMIVLLKEAMSQGAKGLSTGLAYQNANAAPSDEILALVSELKPYEGIYTTHLRTEFDEIISALDEAFVTAAQAKVPLVVSHIKCAGKSNWGRAKEITTHIESHQQHQEISCDCYPYNASSSTLDLTQVTSDFDIFITWSEPFPDKAEQTLADIAKQWQVSLLEAATRLQPAGAVYHGINEEDVEHFLSFEHSMIGSDGLPCDPHPHPRLWGAFPRVLGRYCRDNKLFSLAKAIHKMTGLSAEKFKLTQRGLIKKGYFADLVLFDARSVKDLATFSQPCIVSQGIEAVWVNGQLSYQVDKPQSNTAGAGRFLAHHM